MRLAKSRFGENLFVAALWDTKANVWVATGNAIPALVNKAPLLDDLVRRALLVAFELLDDYGIGRANRGAADFAIVSHLNVAVAS